MHLPGKMVVRVMGGFTEALCYLGRGGWAEAPTKGGGNCWQQWMRRYLPGPGEVEVNWTMPPKAWSLYLILSLFFILASHQSNEKEGSRLGPPVSTACLWDLGQVT